MECRRACRDGNYNVCSSKKGPAGVNGRCWGANVPSVSDIGYNAGTQDDAACYVNANSSGKYADEGRTVGYGDKFNCKGIKVMYISNEESKNYSFKEAIQYSSNKSLFAINDKVRMWTNKQGCTESGFPFSGGKSFFPNSSDEEKRCTCLIKHVENGSFDQDRKKIPKGQLESGVGSLSGWENVGPNEPGLSIGNQMERAGSPAMAVLNGSNSGIKQNMRNLIAGQHYKILLKANSVDANTVLLVSVAGSYIYQEILTDNGFVQFSTINFVASSKNDELVIRCSKKCYLDNLLVVQSDKSEDLCPQPDQIPGSFLQSCSNCTTGFRRNHCTLTCSCTDGEGVDNVSIVNLKSCPEPHNINGRLMCPGTKGDNQAKFSFSSKEKQDIMRHQRLVCGEANEVKFGQMYKNVENRYHVDIPESGEIHFSAKGTSGVNIALVKTSDAKVANMQEGWTGAYDIFIGPETEPVVHFADCMGCKPTSIVNVGEYPLIQEGHAVSVFLSVTDAADGKGGKDIKVGRMQDGVKEWVLETTVSIDIAADEAIFTYGYGDMECKCPVEEEYEIEVERKMLGHNGISEDVHFSKMSVDSRTLIATLEKEPRIVACQGGNAGEKGLLTINLEGTPFEFADLEASELLNGNSISGYTAGSSQFSNGPFFGWGWNMRYNVSCESTQKCSLKLAGECAHGGVGNTRDPLFKSPEGKNVLKRAKQIRLQYLPAYIDGCTSINGLCEADIDDREACGAEGVTEEQCKAEDCCYDEVNDTCFKQSRNTRSPTTGAPTQTPTAAPTSTGACPKSNPWAFTTPNDEYRCCAHPSSSTDAQNDLENGATTRTTCQGEASIPCPYDICTTINANKPTGSWRTDYRCKRTGNNFKNWQGKDATCNVKSEHFCCSQNGYCGGTDAYCSPQHNGINYKYTDNAFCPASEKESPSFKRYDSPKGSQADVYTKLVDKKLDYNNKNYVCHGIGTGGWGVNQKYTCNASDPTTATLFNEFKLGSSCYTGYFDCEQCDTLERYPHVRKLTIETANSNLYGAHYGFHCSDGDFGSMCHTTNNAGQHVVADLKGNKHVHKVLVYNRHGTFKNQNRLCQNGGFQLQYLTAGGSWQTYEHTNNSNGPCKNFQQKQGNVYSFDVRLNATKIRVKFPSSKSQYLNLTEIVVYGEDL